MFRLNIVRLARKAIRGGFGGSGGETPLPLRDSKDSPPNPPSPPVIDEWVGDRGLPSLSAESIVEGQLSLIRWRSLRLDKRLFEGLGIEPTIDDIEYLNNRLPALAATRRKVFEGYVNVWIAGMAEEPIEHNKQNKGRYKANVWLRARFLH